MGLHVEIDTLPRFILITDIASIEGSGASEMTTSGITNALTDVRQIIENKKNMKKITHKVRND